MKERTLKEIEDEMEIRSEQGEIGRVMDLVDEHGNTFDKMHQAIEEGDLKRVIELEKLGVNCAEERFVKVAVMYDRNLIVYHQVKQGASLHDVVEFARAFNRVAILNWAKFAQRNKMGSK